MAITKRLRITVWATADGLASSFSFNLLTDPYWIAFLCLYVGRDMVYPVGGSVTP
jgi:hypothetical protein